MFKDDCYYLGYFSKVIGTKGELALRLDVDNPKDYQKLPSIFVKIHERDQALVPFFVEQAALTSKDLLRVKLRSMDDGQSAKNMVGKEVFLPLSFLPKLEGNQFYFHEVIGYQVIDKASGPIGTLKNILDYPAQQLFEIENEQAVQILIPITDDTVVQLDREHKVIHIQSPEGLIELYTS